MNRMPSPAARFLFDTIPAMSATEYDAVIAGSGPNGLAAGITLARQGLKVLIREASALPGGGMRTAELTLPGFLHDICSAVHPMAGLSPFMRSVPLGKFGLEWAHPEILLSHPLGGGRAAAFARDFGKTAELLGAEDGARWQRLFAPLVEGAAGLYGDLLGPLPWLPRHPFLLARFGLSALLPATGLAAMRFRSQEARALFCGNAAHGFLPLDQPLTAAVGMALSLAGHAGGWPVARGGSVSITKAMIGYFESLGGVVECGAPVRDVRELPSARAVLFDTGPHATAAIARAWLPAGYVERLTRYRYGPGVFKMDYALSGPVPWLDPHSRLAGTVHLGGTMEEMAASESEICQGRAPARPFILVGQQSLCDASRAPEGRQTLWAYAHVPAGSGLDFSENITARIEEYAPGFRDLILASHAMSPDAVARHNMNNVGGDVIGGVMDWRQLFTRPVARWNPYTMPHPALFHCSSSTPPGAGVHGMCGYHAARTALKKVFGITVKLPEV